MTNKNSSKKDTGDHAVPGAPETTPVQGELDHVKPAHDARPVSGNYVEPGRGVTVVDKPDRRAKWNPEDVDPLGFGEAAYAAYGLTRWGRDDTAPFAHESADVAKAWVDAAAAAISAYDAWLIKDANNKADAVFEAATQTAADKAAGAENPADTYAKAVAIEAAQQAKHSR
jgi:hypothetical protein